MYNETMIEKYRIEDIYSFREEKIVEEQKTLLPEWIQEIKTYDECARATMGAAYELQGPYKDRGLLLQALETEMRKVERAREGLKQAQDSIEHVDPASFHVEKALEGIKQALKELEE